MLFRSQLSSEQPEYYTTAISFHSQQAVEKFLKAYLIYEDVEFPRTHDVDYLLAECIKIDKESFNIIDLKSLNDYAVTVRYPDDFMTPSVKAALENKEIALLVKEIVESRIIFEP